MLEKSRTMMIACGVNSFCCLLSSLETSQVEKAEVEVLLRSRLSKFFFLRNATRSTIFTAKAPKVPHVKCSLNHGGELLSNSKAVGKKTMKVGKKEHHLWKKRDGAGSGQKALSLVRTLYGLPKEKEAVYGALDKWIAWETEFPLVAAAKALRILRKQNQWKLDLHMVLVPKWYVCPLKMKSGGLGCRFNHIQLAKWMLSKGQGATMGTYDTLLLAFDMDQRVDEAESLWNMILHVHTRSISKRLFSRMISLYDHHSMQDKIIEIFADMEELSVKPDQDTVRRVAHAFQKLGQEDKKELLLKRYKSKWKYMHFKGERVRVRTDVWDEDEA